MKIQFCSTGNHGLASYRMRCLIPAEQLIRQGVMASVGPDLSDADVVVFGKHLDYTDYEKALTAKLRGRRVVFDVCNDHITEPTIHCDHYLRMLTIANTVVCNTQATADVVGKIVSPSAIHVIGDPYETDDIPRTYTGKDRLLWFGHGSNLSALRKVLPRLGGRPLEVCTAPIPEDFSYEGPLTLTQWHPGILPDVFARNDICIIPGGTSSWDMTKSPNRAVEAIRGGLVVIASLTHELQSWTRDAPVIYVEHDGCATFCGLLDGVMETPESANDILQKQKAFVADRYSPERIGKQWKEVLCD